MSKSLAAALLGLLFGMPAAGQQADSFLTLARDKYLAVPDFRANVECLQTSSTDGSTSLAKATIEVRQPDKFRIDCDKPEPAQIVYDGKILWVYRPNDRTVISTVIRKSPDLLAWFNPYDKLFSSAVIDGARTNGDFQIWLNIPEYKDSLKEIKLIIDRTTHLIDGINATDNSNNTYEYTFTKVKLGAKIKENRFEFTVPSGSRLIEDF